MNRFSEIKIKLAKSCETIYLRAHKNSSSQITPKVLEKVLYFMPFKKWLCELDAQILNQQRRFNIQTESINDLKSPSSLQNFNSSSPKSPQSEISDHSSSSDFVKVFGVLIQDVDMFKSGKIGFLKFVTDAEYVDTKVKVPGIVFMVIK
ncbi:hypothetical protein BB560_002535 [Smittium megazygosporum]|uniref:Uncharacterized protein n=1 Tax=Smittium megazygosporum TaxID=133381 RepID=A0A2T9ZEI5_9FUNG|nr:hypothetical protein BB560_002535 [Smittium megazygosporum]